MLDVADRACPPQLFGVGDVFVECTELHVVTAYPPQFSLSLDTNYLITLPFSLSMSHPRPLFGAQRHQSTNHWHLYPVNTDELLLYTPLVGRGALLLSCFTDLKIPPVVCLNDFISLFISLFVSPYLSLSTPPSLCPSLSVSLHRMIRGISL